MTDTSRDPAAMRRERRLVLSLVVGILIPLADVSMLAPALGAVCAEFSEGMDAESIIRLLLLGHGLAGAAVVPVSRWLGDRVGVRRVWCGALLLSLCAQCLAGYASSVEMLVCARIAQGIAVGLLAPTMQTIAVRGIAPERRRRALALISIPAVMAPVLGPVLGGLLVGAAGWQSVFLAQVPAACIALLVALAWCRGADVREVRTFDWLGFALLCPGFVLLIDAVVRHERSGLQMAGAAIACVLLLGFTVHARRRGPSALLDLRVFADTRFTPAIFLLLLSSVVLYGGLLWFPLLLEHSGAWSATRIGVVMAAQGAGALVARLWMLRMTQWAGDRGVALMAVLCAVAGGLLVMAQDLQHPDALILAGLALRGAGIGALTLLGLTVVGCSTPSERAGTASSVSRMAINIGSAIAVPLILVAIEMAAGQRSEGGAGSWAGHVLLLVMTAACVWPALALDGRRGRGTVQ